MKHATKKRPAHHDSYLEGATDCNHNWMRKLRRMLLTNPKQKREDALYELEDWGKARVARNKKRKGGM